MTDKVNGLSYSAEDRLTLVSRTGYPELSDKSFLRKSSGAGMILATCPSSKYLGPLRLFYKGGSSPSWIDVKPLGADGSSGGFSLV